MTVRRSLAIVAILAAAGPQADAASLCQGGDCSGWMRQAEEACRRAGGTLTHLPTGSRCDRPAGGQAGGGMGGNPYAVLIEQGLQSLWAWEAQSDATSKQRSAAALQAIEVERQNALARQQTAYANSLAEIQRRFAAGIAEGGLKPKLGRVDDPKPSQYGLPGRHVFRNDIFTGGNVDETEKIALTLKLGPDATASLRGTPAAAPAPATAGAQEQRQGNASDDILRIVERLTPEEQQRLAAKLKELSEGAPAPAQPSPVTAPPPETRPATPQLSLKLAEAQKSADQLRADAGDTTKTPEELKHRAELQVTPPGSAAPRAAQPTNPVAPRTPQPAAPQAKPVAPRATQPAAPQDRRAATEPQARIQAPEQSDLQLLFRDNLRVANAAPRAPASASSNLVLPRTDDPFSFTPPDDRDLFALLQSTGTPQDLAQRRELAAGLVISAATVVSPDSGASGYQPNYLQREALIAHYAPELLERYRSDRGFAARVDAAIAESIRHGRGFRADLDMAAWNRSGKPAWESPEFRKQRIDNVKNAQIQMSVHMSASFAELRGR